MSPDHARRACSGRLAGAAGGSAGRARRSPSVERRGMTTTPGQTVATTEAPADDEYFGEMHVYQPHRAGIPDLRVYFKQLWARRQFAAELSRSGMRAAHTNTFFGQLWLVINPLLLAL